MQRIAAAVAVLAAVVPELTAAASLRKPEPKKLEVATKVAEKPKSFRQVLHNHQNVQYFADFLIGGQKISGIFDTGSFELLVRSSRCDECVHPTPPYDHSKSSTYHKNGTLTKHVFGSGPCISMMGYESVEVSPQLVSKNQVFWEIVAHKIAVLNNAKFAAIVGIGPNFAYGNKEKTLLMNYGVDEFSICLQKQAGSTGFLTWGPEQKQLKSDEVITARVQGAHHWATELRDVTFNASTKGQHLAINPCGGEKGCAAIIDSGTSLIAAPSHALVMLSKQVGHIMEDCSNLHELPTLHFTLDGHAFELPPQAYVMRVTGATLEADNIWDILFFKPKIRKMDMCMPAFMEINMMSQNGPVWILGMPFFRYYHTTFDRKNKVMRFAQAGADCQPVAIPPAVNKSKGAFIATASVHSAEAYQPLNVEVSSIIPPSLSAAVVQNGKDAMIEL